MCMTDTVADYLTRIRNATIAKHHKVDIPTSNAKRHITRILNEYGYIKNYILVDDGKNGLIRIYLKYDANGDSVITGLKKVSTPGLRSYVKNKDLPRVRNNFGLAILSTPKGIVSDRDARKLNVGGEVLCHVW